MLHYGILTYLHSLELSLPIGVNTNKTKSMLFCNYKPTTMNERIKINVLLSKLEITGQTCGSPLN